MTTEQTVLALAVLFFALLLAAAFTAGAIWGARRAELRRVPVIPIRRLNLGDTTERA